MRITRLLAPLFVAFALTVAGVASAQNVDLKGGSASTSGTVTIKIDDFGSCSEGLTIDVDFSASKRKFTAMDNEGRTLKGKYKQKGTDNRKLTIRLTSSSKKTLEKAVKKLVKSCTGASKVEVDLDNTKITAKVNADRDSLKIKGKADVEGKADGEKGDAKYKFTTNGPLTLAPM